MSETPLSHLPDVDEVIHSPARLGIVSILATVKEADFLYLLNAANLTRGNLSTHLGKLEQAGYVEIEKTYRGKLPLTLCRLTPAGRTAFEAYRKSMLDFLGKDT